jgi:hypothetical protein
MFRWIGWHQHSPCINFPYGYRSANTVSVRINIPHLHCKSMLDQSGRVPFTVCGMGMVQFLIAGSILPVSIILFDKQLWHLLCRHPCIPLGGQGRDFLHIQAFYLLILPCTCRHLTTRVWECTTHRRSHGTWPMTGRSQKPVKLTDFWSQTLAFL